MGIRGMVVGAGMLIASTGAALADMTFNFTNVTFFTSASGGSAVGTLTGSFTTNNALTSLTGFNITASAVANNFVGFNFTSVTAFATVGPFLPSGFEVRSNDQSKQLRIIFSTPLTAAGAAISQSSSYEYEQTAGGFRYPSGRADPATVAAVPAPVAGAGLPLVVGMAGAWYARRRRLKRAA